jgi:two-component system KDP operon response regulator KdpE
MASLRVFMASLRKKVDTDPDQPLIQTHIGIGYRMNRI